MVDQCPDKCAGVDAGVVIEPPVFLFQKDGLQTRRNFFRRCFQAPGTVIGEKSPDKPAMAVFDDK
jgi:hypothetical protein